MITTIKLEWIQCFLEVAKLSSTNRVADKLFTSQSTISRNIAQLEQQLNTKLFHRTYAGMLLTKDGELLFPYAEQYLNAYQQLLAAAKDITKREQIDHILNNEPIHIFASHDVMEYYGAAILQLPDINPENILFHKLPQAEIEFNNLFLTPNSFVILPGTNSLKQQLAKELKTEILLTSKLYVLCAKNSKFFSPNTKTVTIKSLKKLPFVICTEGTFLARLMDNLFGDNQPNISTVPKANLLMQHIINDNKVSISVDIFKNNKNDGNIQSPYFYTNATTDSYTKTIPISTKIYAELLLIYKPESISPKLQDFITALKTIF